MNAVALVANNVLIQIFFLWFLGESSVCELNKTY